MILILLACTNPGSTVDPVPVQGFDSAADTGTPDTDADTGTGAADTDADTDSDPADTADTGTTDTDTGAPPDTGTDTPTLPECWDGTWVDDFGNPIDAGVGLVGASTSSAADWLSADLWMDESTHTGTVTLATCGTAFRFVCGGTVELAADQDRADFGGLVTYTATQVRSTVYGMGDTDHCQFYAAGLVDGVEAQAADAITVRF